MIKTVSGASSRQVRQNTYFHTLLELPTLLTQLNSDELLSLEGVQK